MRKIKVGIGGNAFEQHAGPHAAELVPAHVRKPVGGRKRGDVLREHREPSVTRRFIAGRKHGLQAEADPEQRNALCDGLAQRDDQRAFVERVHQRAEMPHAGENKCVAGSNRLGSRGPAGFHAETRECPLDRRKIPCSVFHQRDVHSSPFVLGNTRFNCGSRVAANRSARANALKMAST